MSLLNIEAGPWGGLVLIVALLATVAALYFTTWIVSGVALVLVVVVPIALALYFGGRRVSHRLVHGR
jgi:fatty acid desaturase